MAIFRLFIYLLEIESSVKTQENFQSYSKYFKAKILNFLLTEKKFGLIYHIINFKVYLMCNLLTIKPP